MNVNEYVGNMGKTSSSCIRMVGTSLVVQCLTLLPLLGAGACSFPDQGTRIWHAAQDDRPPPQKKIRIVEF